MGKFQKRGSKILREVPGEDPEAIVRGLRGIVSRGLENKKPPVRESAESNFMSLLLRCSPAGCSK